MRSPFPGFDLRVGRINGWEIYLYDTDWNLRIPHTSSIEKNGKEGIQPEEHGWYEFDHLPCGQYIVPNNIPGWAQVAPRSISIIPLLQLRMMVIAD